MPTPDRPAAPFEGGGSPEQLLPLVYEELRRIAVARTTREPVASTLQPTAMVHEAYLHLVGPEGDEVRWDHRGQFFAAAAMAMRKLLVERARQAQRSGTRVDPQRVELVPDQPVDPTTTDLLAIDEALDQLGSYDARKAQVVMLRYFAGLTVEQTAKAMDLPLSTIHDEWRMATAWLQRALARTSL
jgi:RNA polymerase sigma factor (TIGR02999 family)